MFWHDIASKLSERFSQRFSTCFPKRYALIKFLSVLHQLLLCTDEWHDLLSPIINNYHGPFEVFIHSISFDGWMLPYIPVSFMLRRSLFSVSLIFSLRSSRKQWNNISTVLVIGSWLYSERWLTVASKAFFYGNAIYIQCARSQSGVKVCKLLSGLSQSG